MASVNLGRVGLALRGTWDSATAYVPYDVVSYLGNSYAARVASINVEPTNQSYWQSLAQNQDYVDQINGYLTQAQGYAQSAQSSASQAASSAESANDNIATEYSSTATYAVGDYAIYESNLYRCTTAIETAETFDSAHWAAVTVGGELAPINTNLSYLIEVSGSDVTVLPSTEVIQARGTYDTLGDRIDTIETLADQSNDDLRASLFKTATVGNVVNHVYISDAVEGPVEVGLTLTPGQYNANLYAGPYTVSGVTIKNISATGGTAGKRYMLSFLCHEEAEDNPPCTASVTWYDTDGTVNVEDSVIISTVGVVPTTFPRDSQRYATFTLPASARGDFFFTLSSIKSTVSLSEIMIAESTEAYPDPFHEASEGRPLFSYTGATLTMMHLGISVVREINYPAMVYGGGLKLLRSGVAELTAYPAYESYNGETLVGPWLSSLDEYQEGATPTMGAQVVDLGGVEIVTSFPGAALLVYSGDNTLYCASGDGDGLNVTYLVNVETFKPSETYTAADSTSGVAIWSYGGVAGAFVATSKNFTFNNTSFVTIKTGLKKPKSTTIYFPVILTRTSGSAASSVLGLGRVNGTTLSVAAPAQGIYYPYFSISYPVTE